MTKDLALCVHGDQMDDSHWVTTEDFLDALDRNLSKRLSTPL